MRFASSLLPVAGIALLLSVASVPAAAQVTIDTRPGGVVTNTFFGDFGEGFFNVFGQTFVAPTDRFLNEFTFWVQQGSVDNQSPPVRFRGFIALWDDAASAVVSPLLFTSGDRQTTLPNILQEFSFSTGSLELTPGQRYIAFINTFPLHNGVRDNGSVNAAGETYSGGNFFFLQNGSSAGFFGRTWGTFGSGDLSFRATFSPTAAAAAAPEPGTLALVGMVSAPLVAGIAAGARRRKPAKS